jgi:YHS domain-containing protein
MATMPVVSVTDPICGMTVTAAEAAARFTFIGVTYFFCSVECRDLFQLAPERHLVFLAHEPSNEHYGYCCPTQRQLRGGHAAEDCR